MYQQKSVIWICGMFSSYSASHSEHCIKRIAMLTCGFPGLWYEVACISVYYSYTQDYLTSDEELYFRVPLEYKDYHLGIRTRLIVSYAAWY